MRAAAIGLFAALACLLLVPTAHGARSISIDDVSITEPSGMDTATFTLTLSQRAKRAVFVDFTTVAGTAQSPSDFTEKNGTAKVKRDRKRAKIDVTVNGDAEPEDAEGFTVQLSNPRRATIGDPEGLCTILDND